FNITSCNPSIIPTTSSVTYIGAFNGTFRSDFQMNNASTIRLDIYYTSTEDSNSSLNTPLMMSAIDP
ncbi:11662_t:CDS:1, partial [Racocetra persica]